MEIGDLLGRAMVHEIGHMLIGTPAHSRFGLMRAVWASSELRRGMPLDWVFSPKEGSELRRRLMARTSAPAVPEPVVASALRLSSCSRAFRLPPDRPAEALHYVMNATSARRLTPSSSWP